MKEWNLDMQGKGIRGKLLKVDLFNSKRTKHKDKTPFGSFSAKESEIQQELRRSYHFDSQYIHLMNVDQSNEQKDSNLPLIINNTKDHFAFDLHESSENIVCRKSGRKY